jgi:hypothetical protein
MEWVFFLIIVVAIVAGLALVADTPTERRRHRHQAAAEKAPMTTLARARDLIGRPVVTLSGVHQSG